MANTKANTNTKKQFFLIRWFKSLWNYFVESYKELKKVSWPTRKELFKSTWVVIVIVAIVALLVYGFDALFSWLTNIFYNLV